MVDKTRPIIARTFPLFFFFPVLDIPIKLRIIPKTGVIPRRVITIIMKTGTVNTLVIPNTKPVKANTLISPNKKPIIANSL